MVKNMQPLEIAVATRHDLHEVAAFLDDCWRTAYREIVSSDYLDSMSVDVRYKKLLARFDETSANFLVMRDANLLVGVAVFGKSYTDGYPDDGEISAIYIRHDYIGKGHGHALFSRVEAALAARGHAYFVLDVLSENTHAIAFYHRHDYENVAERSIRLGEKDYPLIVFHKKSASRCIISVRKNPEYLDRAVDYLSSKWSVAFEVYRDCISHSITTHSPLPQWYLLLDENSRIVGSYGLITNDFNSRQDLWPWLAALYVEESERGQSLGGKMLAHGAAETKRLGFNKLYLTTNHIGYYEKYGFTYIGQCFGHDGETGRLYEINACSFD